METKPLIDYKKYRWFYTSSEKLVIGGKSSIQNDELLKKLKRARKNYIVMHTSSPGSPFSIILSDTAEVTPSDIEETAIFTGCFSRAWREQKKKTTVDIFQLSSLYKLKNMKIGTWGVKGSVQKKTVNLELVLTKQQDRLRAVPEKTVKKKKEILLKVTPGKLDKREMIPKFSVVLEGSIKHEELLSALPPGGVAISKSK